MLKRIAKDPLSHFLVVGVLIFIVVGLFADRTQTPIDNNKIIVDQQSLLTYLQYRSKAFDPDTFNQVLASMSEAERNKLIDDYVRDEVLYREAVALGLDQSDAVIRQRLNQRMEFALRGLVSGSVDINEEQLAAYFETHEEDYEVAAHATFAHIYFNGAERGWGNAKSDAQALLEDLTQKETPIENVSGLGDEFAYFENYVERTPDFVASHFGNEMSEQVFALSPQPDTWVGPFKSPLGFHLVQVLVNENARPATLDEVRALVREDAERAQLQENMAAALAALTERYEIEIRDVLDGNAQ